MTDDDLDLLGALADAAGAAIRPFFRARFDIETKPDLSPVTEVDRAAESVIRDYIAERHPDEAARVADYVSTTMSGLSAKARNGHHLDQLLATARLAGLALAQALPA